MSAESCPGYGGRLEHKRVSFAYVTDIPPMPRPDVKGYRVQICRCAMSCGKRVRGRHRDIAPDQYGASAHRVGKRVMAAGPCTAPRRGRSGEEDTLHTKDSEWSEDKPERDHTGRAAPRERGSGGTPTAGCAVRCAQARSSTPTTRAGVWAETLLILMAFETDEATVYRVRSRHRNEEVRELIPIDYGGVMVTDRGRSYDSRTLSGVKQQKCMAHILRSISEALETKVGRGRSFGKRLMELLREAIELRESERRGEASNFVAESERLKRELSNHLRERPMPDPDNQRLSE